MTPSEFYEARKDLGLSRGEMALMLGCEGDLDTRARQIRKMEKGKRPILESQARLVRAYLNGYRPGDWPPNRYEWPSSYADIGLREDLQHDIEQIFPTETPLYHRKGRAEETS